MFAKNKELLSTNNKIKEQSNELNQRVIKLESEKSGLIEK